MRTFWVPTLSCLLSAVALAQSSPQMTIVNGASFDASQPIPAGAFASAFGNDLCPQAMTGTWLSPGQLPVSLGGCSVTVNGMPAMLYYVSPGQVNFIMPGGVGTGPATVTVNNGAVPVTGTTTTGPAGPGMFALNGMGMGEAAVLNATMWRMGPFSTSTDGQPTYLAIYATGLDPSVKPEVSIGGMPADVMWWGDAPGYAGLQQINIALPSAAAGVGRAPVMVTSGGQVSNVTFMHILPTTSMMQGMPGWGQGMMVAENMARGHEMNGMAFNGAAGTALVTDENDDVVRVISLASNTTTATITLPAGSLAHAIAVNAAGTLAAAVLSAKASVAIIDLAQNKVVSVVGTGYYPSMVAFSGSSLLVTNAASGNVSVIDTTTGAVTQTVATGLGASGIAVSAGTAVVANMQAGTVSVINLSDYTVSTVTLPAGSRPHQVAISDQGNKAVITTPMSNGFLILDLGTKTLAPGNAGTWNGMGPGAVVTSGNTVYIANQMTATVTVVDLPSATVQRTFSVDPGPTALAVVPAKNQLLVMAEGTGTLDVVDLSSYGIVARLNAGDTERVGRFTMPWISAITPNTAAAGSTFTLTIAGSDLQTADGVAFYLTSVAAGNGGMMGGGGMGGNGMGGGMGQQDPNITVSEVHVSSEGTQLTATVQIAAGAAAGTRQIRLGTNYGAVMGMVTNSLFTVTR